MATALRLDGFTATYVAPGCFDLPAQITPAENGHKLITTAWELDQQEKAAVLSTGIVTVGMLDNVPPMNVGTVTVEASQDSYCVSTPLDPAKTQSLIVPAQEVLLLVLHLLTEGAQKIEIERV